MKTEKVNLEEERLLDERDIEFAHGIRNGPAYKAYNAFIAEKKRKKLEQELGLL